MKWLVIDSLYCTEAFFCGHLDSLSHYLNEARQEANALEAVRGAGYQMARRIFKNAPNVVMVLDRYDHISELYAGRHAIEAGVPIPKLVAQVAAICNPMPWKVRMPDGSPAYDLVISSLRWMVEEARAHGCRAEYMPLAFDHRALVCGMDVTERDIPCLFVGTTGGNHQRRTALLRELADVVTVAPPTFGREYFRLLARAKSVLHCGAEWARGEMNAMRVTEAMGMGALLIVDAPSDDHGFIDGEHCRHYRTAADVREIIARVDSRDMLDIAECGHAEVLTHESYVSRIPELIRLAKSLPQFATDGEQARRSSASDE